jgi:transposase
MPKGQPNKRYTPEFKIKVVETMHREKLSYRETARQFDICDHDRVAAWERIYLEEGAEGLYAERRGRKSTGRPPKIKKEDLIAEVQRLRAENAYLKKLNALVAERVQQEKKQKSLDAEQYALKEILIFMEKADSDRRVSLASAIMDCRKARIHLSFCAKN